MGNLEHLGSTHGATYVPRRSIHTRPSALRQTYQVQSENPRANSFQGVELRIVQQVLCVEFLQRLFAWKWPWLSWGGSSIFRVYCLQVLHVFDCVLQLFHTLTASHYPVVRFIDYLRKTPCEHTQYRAENGCSMFFRSQHIPVHDRRNRLVLTPINSYTILARPLHDTTSL